MATISSPTPKIDSLTPAGSASWFAGKRFEKTSARRQRTARQKRGAITPFPIVGIGTSAGGLEPCERLLRRLPASTGMAFVLVQHLDPTHESRLTEILAHQTSMTVAEAVEGMPVTPNHVYVIPPNKSMSLGHGVLHLEPRRKSKAQHLPIDSFFRSLATAQGNMAIGVILSGNASDGVAGMTAIKEHGGITFAQDADSAKYNGMPHSAITSGAVDFVLPPEEIARYLARIGNNPHTMLPDPKEAEEDMPPGGPEDADAQLFSLLKKSSNVDFGSYKSTTIGRRIKRRMTLHGIDTTKAYIRYVKQRPEELQALVQDILIGVTEFFREPGTFKVLAKTVYPALLKNRPSDAPLRIWVPGCSTGEEVYSVAISVLEHLGSRAASTTIQIFGTDANEQAIKRARVGQYSKEIASRMSPRQLRRFFLETDAGYQINKSVRDLCVFARHNVTRDAPFRNLDLVSCRNLLIYLNSAVHRKLIPLFHYTLKPVGFLVLGAAETVGAFSELFSLKDRRYKVYQKAADASRASFEFPQEHTAESRAATEPPPGPHVPRSNFDLQRLAADQLILNQYGPPSVLVTENMDILHFRGHTSLFLQPAHGVASLNLRKMAREGLVVGLQSAFEAARKKDRPAQSEGLRIDTYDQPQAVTIKVVPITMPRLKERTFLVMFEDYRATRRPAGRKSEASSEKSPALSRIKALREELAATKSYLQAVIANQEVANEELRSLNEEEQSSNEELQSTTEELETANEEMQSANEELNTLNEELERLNGELSLLNNDVLNLLHGLNLIVLMLDRGLRIRRFTPAAQKALNLLPSDINRALRDVRFPVDLLDLECTVLQVMESGDSKEREIQDREGRWYSLQIRPYVTIEGKIEGGIVVLYDIHEAKQRSAEVADANARLQIELTSRRQAEEKFEAIVESEPDALVVSDRRGKIALVNGRTESIFGYRRVELAGRSIDLLLAERLRKQHVSHRCQYMEPGARPVGLNLDLIAVRKNGSEFPVEITMSEFRSGDEVMICSVIRDVTQQKALLEEARQAALLEERNRVARDVHDTLAQGLTGIVLQLESAEEACPEGGEETRKHIARARSLARENLEQARHSVFTLTPLSTEEDLARSLRHLVESLNPDLRAKVEFALRGRPRPLDAPLKENLARIAQQTLTNALQHAHAGKIRIELAFVGKQVRLQVSDDGHGFSISELPADRMGLRNIRHRAKEIRGKLELKSKPGKGTRVAVTVPLPLIPAASS